MADLMKEMRVVLAAARKRRKLSLRAAARGIGCSFATVGQMETGSRNPGLFTAIAWANFFGYDLVLQKKVKE